MYEIRLENIEEFCAKVSGNQNEKKLTVIDFFSMLEESITMKKILFRQNQLSEMIEHQNRARYRQLFESS